MKRFAAILVLVLWPAILHAGPTQQILDHYEKGDVLVWLGGIR